MTLILAVSGRESIWLLADRRLSYVNRPPNDYARKAMVLETMDGTSILGYAGLGATSLGTEPADWMNSVLLGMNLPLENNLTILAEAAKNQLPNHLKRFPRNVQPGHNIIIPSIVNNEIRLYTIDLILNKDRKGYQFRHTQWKTEAGHSPRIALGGTGGFLLSKNRTWARNLFNLINANDKKKASSKVVADYLASLNYKVSLDIEDKSVGPSCIVIWRNRLKGIHKGGGGHQSYTGLVRDNETPPIPILGNGRDIQAVYKTLMPLMMENLDAFQNGEAPKTLDRDEINKKLANLPDTPDEMLR